MTTWFGLFLRAFFESDNDINLLPSKIIEITAIVYVKVYGSNVIIYRRSLVREQLGGPYMLEDKLLVLKCRRGSKDAMCRVYEKYKDYLLTLAKGLLNNQEAAEDVVHDVFVSFARSARQFQLTGSLRGYLATCVSNRVRDKIRAKTRQTEALESTNPAVLDSANPEQCVIEEELIRLRQALRQIPYEQREAVILHLKGDMKFREIAKQQGVPISTIHGRYRYGLDKLRSMLNGEVEK
jgi:RNA polymerase sigma-70 factor (ECF subfamily)